MRAAGFRSVALAVAWRNVHRMLANPQFLIPVLIFPLFFLAAFAGGLSPISRLPSFNFPSGYTAFQFVFVLLQTAAFGGVFTGFGIAGDFESGFGRRFMLAAPNRNGIIAGYMLASLFRAALTWTVLVTAALIGGMQIGGNGVDVFGLFALALMVNIASILWACGTAMRVRSMQGGPLIQLPVFLVLFLAPVYVPLDLLSGWIHTVAKVNPVTALLEAGRGLISGEPELVGLAFAIALGLAVAFAFWARGGLRSAEAAGG